MKKLNESLTSKQKLAALSELANSKGWALLHEVMSEEIDVVLSAHIGSPSLTEDEKDWRRGVLYASRRFLNLPEALSLRYENDAVLENATKTDKQGSKR